MAAANTEDPGRFIGDEGEAVSTLEFLRQQLGVSPPPGVYDPDEPPPEDDGGFEVEDVGVATGELWDPSTLSDDSVS